MSKYASIMVKKSLKDLMDQQIDLLSNSRSKMSYSDLIIYMMRSQLIFMWADGWVVVKGSMRNKYCLDLYKENPEGFSDYLDELYNHKESNILTKWVIEQIRKEIRIEIREYKLKQLGI